MPSQQLGPNYRATFGQNVWLRSTVGYSVDSATVAASTVPAQTIDGYSQKVLQPGVVLAKITSTGASATPTPAADVGKVGPFDAGATDGRQTQANIVGINDTFLPYELGYRDVEVAVVYRATGVQANCFEVATGAYVALTDATKAKVVAQNPGIVFRLASTEL